MLKMQGSLVCERSPSHHKLRHPCVNINMGQVSISGCANQQGAPRSQATTVQRVTACVQVTASAGHPVNLPRLELMNAVARIIIHSWRHNWHTISATPHLRDDDGLVEDEAACEVVPWAGPACRSDHGHLDSIKVQ